MKLPYYILAQSLLVSSLLMSKISVWVQLQNCSAYLRKRNEGKQTTKQRHLFSDASEMRKTDASEKKQNLQIFLLGHMLIIYKDTKSSS